MTLIKFKTSIYEMDILSSQMTLLISHLTLKKSIITFYFLEDMHDGVIVSLDSSKLLLKGTGDHLHLFLDLNFHCFFC